MPEERLSSGFIRKKLSYREFDELRTINDVEAEYWTLLLFYADVPEEGKKLIKTSSERLRKAAYPAISAFIKQAKTYYDAAKPLHHRAASLNYYYCFMNLAKAAILCNTPRLYNKRFVHGLSGRNSDHKNLFDRTSRVFVGTTREGDLNAFDQLYELHYGMGLPNGTFLKIGTLMRYCSEATNQVQISSGESPKQLPAFYALRVAVPVVEGGHPTFWPLIGLYGSGLFDEFPSFSRKLTGEFERVNVPQEAARNMFNIYAEEHARVAYYQSRQVFDDLPGTDVYKVSREKIKAGLGSNLYPNYYGDPYDFFVTLPIRSNLQKPMNESLATYVIMHHLSELVRYRPHYLEKLLSSKEAWALESIIDTAPAMFMRGIVPLITQRDTRIVSR